MFNLDKISKYIENPKLKESVFVDDISSIHFHWSNHKVTKKLAQSSIKVASNISNDILWIKNNESYLKLSKKDIADFIATNNFKDENLFDVKEITDCLNKDFKDCAIIDHVTQSDLKAAYYRMSLKNKVPQRSFRLSTQEKVLFCYSNNFLKETKVVVHQFSHSGILFKCENKDFLEIFEENDLFKIYIDSKSLTSKGSAYSECEKYAFTIKKDQVALCDQFLDEDYFFYIRYADMKNSNIKNDLCSYLQLFESNVIKKIA